jgi:hypothetical protein
LQSEIGTDRELPTSIQTPQALEASKGQVWINMNWPKLIVTLVVLLCLAEVPVRAAQNQFTIDATKQPSPPVRGRGPYPGSTTPGHSADLPIRLELLFPTTELRSGQTALLDFIITNVGSEPITLPVSIDQNIAKEAAVLTLWLTSDAIKAQYLKQTGRLFKFESVGTSVELYGSSNNPGTLHVLASNESCRVHASSRIQLNPGTYSITAHAELVRVSLGTSERVGTADSVAVRKTLATEPQRHQLNLELALRDPTALEKLKILYQPPSHQGYQAFFVYGDGALVWQAYPQGLMPLAGVPTCRNEVNLDKVQDLVRLIIQKHFFDLSEKRFLEVNGPGNQGLETHAITIDDGTGKTGRIFAVGEYAGQEESIPPDFSAIETELKQLRDSAFPLTAKTCPLASPIDFWN